MRTTALVLFSALTAFAQTITLTPAQERSWQIETASAKAVSQVAIGDFMVEVALPPQRLQTLSLPFEAQMTQLHTAQYAEVRKGDVLAHLSGVEWITMQKEAISASIALKQQALTTERKMRLCKEEIIAQKECIAAKADLQLETMKLEASKTMLKSYGATDTMIDKLLNELTIFPDVPLSSPVDGTIIQLNVKPGENVAPSSALFIIQRQGDYWIESDLRQQSAMHLSIGQKVTVTLDGTRYACRVLHLSPTVNPINQTRHVRFALDNGTSLFAGMRSSASLTLGGEAVLVNKNSVVKNGTEHIVFIKEKDTYRTVAVNILGETAESYYLRRDTALLHPIVLNAAAVFKGMLGEGDNE